MRLIKKIASSREVVETIPRGTELFRIHDQKQPGLESFNPTGRIGRATPVLDNFGAALPYLYVGVGNPAGLLAEQMHYVAKQYLSAPASSMLSPMPLAAFTRVRLSSAKTTAPLKLVSMSRLIAKRGLIPPAFSAPDADYTLTARITQKVLALHPDVAGICWPSARGALIVACLFDRGVFDWSKMIQPIASMRLLDAFDHLTLADALMEHGIDLERPLDSPLP
jgi:hypothetical protein